MRMWLVAPKYMCRQHLLGEHAEMHMFVGAINKGTSLDGYILNNLLDPSKIRDRHDELAEEIVRRGFNHQSPLQLITKTINTKVIKLFDPVAAEEELMRRCSRCNNRKIILSKVRRCI